MINALVCIPYLELKEPYERCIRRYSDKDISFEVRHIIGIHEALENAVMGKDIVVARGITAATVAKEWPSKHLIEIELTGYDVLHAIIACREKYKSKNIAIIYAETLRCDERMLSDLTGIPVTVKKVSDEIETRAAILDYAAAGVDTFVVGRTGAEICDKNGLAYVSVDVGKEAIERSVLDAITAARTMEYERSKSVLIRQLLNDNADGEIAVDTEGNIVEENRMARELVGSSMDNIPEWREALASETGFERVRMFNNLPCIVRYVPVFQSGKPIGVNIVIQNSERLRESDSKIRRELKERGFVARYSFSDIKGESGKLLEMKEKAKKFSQVLSSVLITGETGTGKELFAHSIHSASPRAWEPFVAVNCATLPGSLLESELFGYVEGAFSGAVRGGKAGLFEIAHKGTIFLDEIGEIPLPVQSKLLRVLQESEIRRVGDTRVRHVDVRIIAATNVDMKAKVREGLFRSDLYYRLSVLDLHLAPLRERGNDILLLADMFLERYASRSGRRKPVLSRDAENILMSYSWPGNIRELRNICEKIIVLSDGDTISGRDLDGILSAGSDEKEGRALSIEELASSGIVKKGALADALGISRTTLWRRMKESNVKH